MSYNKEKEEIIFLVDYESVYDQLAMSPQEFFDNEVEAQAGQDDSLNDCVEGCIDDYTDADGNKIAGRGKCKGRCWAEFGVRVLDAVLPF